MTREWSQNHYADWSGFPELGLYGAATAYDPIRNRVVIFGGNDGLRAYQDTWQFEMAPETNRLLPTEFNVHGQFSQKRTFASGFYDLDALWGPSPTTP